MDDEVYRLFQEGLAHAKEQNVAAAELIQRTYKLTVEAGSLRWLLNQIVVPPAPESAPLLEALEVAGAQAVLEQSRLVVGGIEDKLNEVWKSQAAHREAIQQWLETELKLLQSRREGRLLE
jgi:hypothetical protein